MNMNKDPLKIIGTVFDDKGVSIKILDYINSGSFGYVYKVKYENNDNDKEYALKIPKIQYDNLLTYSINKKKRETSAKLIKKEVSIYKKLKLNQSNLTTTLDTISIPDYQEFVITLHCEKVICVLMTLLGSDLIDYSKMFKGSRIDLRNLILLTIKSITLLKHIHSKGILHQDIKPENILLDKSFENIYLIDFGLSMYFLDDNMKHIPCCEKAFLGTPRYASIASHNFKQQSRKDDLESLCYMLIYMFKGDLPWCNIDKKLTKKEKYNIIKKLKEDLKDEDIIKESFLPKEYYKMLYYVKNLEYGQTPSYNTLKKMFIDLYINKFGIDNIQLDKF